VSFKFVLAPVNKVSMATNNRLLSFYTLPLKLKLVCHILFNGHEIFSQASLVILLQEGFPIFDSYSVLQVLNCVEINKSFPDCLSLSLKTLALSTHCSKPEGIIKNCFVVKLLKKLGKKFHAH